MLNGLAPLLVIVIKQNPPETAFGPPVPEGLLDLIGIPIPIYLSEKLTGIYVDMETRSIDMTTKVEASTSKNLLTQQVEPPQITQQILDTQVTINLLASRDSILLMALLAIMEFIIPRAVSREYAIHYLNGPTAIFGGLLHRFATTVDPNTDLIRMELILSTAGKEAPSPKAPIAAVTKITGAVPL